MAALTLHLAGHKLSTHRIEKTTVYVGRDPACEIVIDSKAVSRQHCRIEYTGGAFVIHDLSSNGVLLGGVPVKEHALTDGDRVRIASFTLQFVEDLGPAAEELAVVERDPKDIQFFSHDFTSHITPEDTRTLIEQLDRRAERDLALILRADRLHMFNTALRVLLVLGVLALLSHFVFG